MIDLGLTAAELQAYYRALVTNHPVDVRIQLLDRSEVILGDWSVPFDQVEEGTVNVDSGGDVTRTLVLRVGDEDGRIQFDPLSPSNATASPTHLLSVERVDWVEELSRWIPCPEIFGPVTTLGRAGAEVSISASGKDALIAPPHGLPNGMTISAGKRVKAAIEDVAIAFGEKPENIQLPESLTQTVPYEIPIPAGTSPWSDLRQLVASFQKQLFYDARGKLRVRDRQSLSQPVFVFHDVDEADLPDERFPTVTYEGNLSDEALPNVTAFDIQTFANYVIYTGGVPPQKKDPIKKVANLNDTAKWGNHPLSPRNLARNGKDRYIVATYSNDLITSEARLQALADAALEEKSNLATAAEFQCAPVPHLQERDPYRLVFTLAKTVTDVNVYFGQGTIPLLPAHMSVGTLERGDVLGPPGRRRGKR